MGEDNADHFGWNSTDFVNSSIPTNSAILNTQGEFTNISNVADSFFTNIESIRCNLEMTHFILAENPTLLLL